MNEVMLTESFGSRFLFLQNKFKNSSPVSKLMKEDSEPLDRNPAVLNYKMNNVCEKDTDSHSEDSVLCNPHDTFGKPSNNSRIQPVLNSEFSDSSSADYEIVAVNVENTTVINTTYNLLSQSTVKNAEKKEYISNSMQKSPHKLSCSVDKSRVVVQVLTSNAESHVYPKNKNHSAQSSNICNFRDDVFKMLSKAKPTCDSKYQFGKSQIVTGNKNNHSQSSNIYGFRGDVLKMLSNAESAECYVENGDYEKDMQIDDAANEKNSVMKITSEHKSSNYIQNCRKNLKFSFLNGKGTKLSEIEFVASNVRNASSRLLRILHYILYNAYGPCSNGVQLSKTRENILLFCGYPFGKDSETYSKKKNCLLRLPFPILWEMYQAVIGNGCKNRSEMVIQLVDFFMKPTAWCSDDDEAEADSENESESESQKVLPEKDEYTYLKKIALREPLPTVKLKRLTKEDIEELQNKTMLDSGLEINETDSSGEVANYFVPAYILKGPGMKLKSFPKVVKRVCRANNRIIEIIHYILYGRIESTKTSMRNILEFSGFLPCQNKFISERETMLKNMKRYELFQLCNLFCLQGKTNTRSVRVKKILAYLSKPTEPKKCRTFQKGLNKDLPIVRTNLKNRKSSFQRSINEVPPVVRPQRRNKKSFFQKKVQKVHHPAVTSRLNYEKACHPTNEANIDGPKLRDFKNSHPTNEANIDGPKLRDFKNICSNIECASPSDLTELNDLLFIKPSDESEIHQRILDFTPFDFSTNSMEYHYRKTLLHYMSFCIIKKIAQLLDIEEWEKSNSQSDLSSSILNFLMEMKPTDSHSRKVPPSVMTSRDSPTRNKKSDKHKSQILQIYEKKTVENWSFKGEPKAVQNQESPSDHPFSDGKSIISHKNQAASKESVFIHRLKKASVHTDDFSQNANDYLASIVSQNEENATPLLSLLHHPSDPELQQIITNIIKSDLWSITMGELVQKVYYCYPEFNLSYRENFIKEEARLIISQLRSNAVDTINSMQCRLSDVI